MMNHTITVDELPDYAGPPLYLFLGVSTSGSQIHRAYPLWREFIDTDSVILGVDLPESAHPARFRRLVEYMAENPRIRGAVVTSHKLRLHDAVIDLVDTAEPLVHLTREINSLDTRSGVKAFARDPQSLDVVLDHTGGLRPDSRRPVICIGAGGSATALLLAMGMDVPATIAQGTLRHRSGHTARGPLTILGRRQQSLDAVAEVARAAGLEDYPLELVLATDAVAIADVCRSAAPGTLIANSTGMGKLRPGSPLPDHHAFRPGVVAWDFNYRGPLTFLEQARSAGVVAVDGWDYFVAGWASALTAAAGCGLDAGLLARFARASEHLRP